MKMVAFSTASILAILVIFSGRSVQGHGGGEHGGDGDQWSGHPEHGWSNCTATRREIVCLHDHLVLILKVALSDYLYTRPSLKSQAPWFNPLVHLNIQCGPFDDIILFLLSEEAVRECLRPCTQGSGNATRPYVPSSPVQMFRDIVDLDVEIKSTL